MKLYLAQINTTVGDYKGNYAKILEHVKRAEKENADMAVFPEMCRTGNPPMDLLNYSSFAQKSEDYMKKLAGDIGDTAALIGYVEWEEHAREWLEQRGLSLEARNYACRQGEIDLIMRQGEQLVFVEVRYRRSPDYGSALESVDRRKQQKLLQAAGHYLRDRRQGTEPPCRFDVVAISGEHGQQIDWIEDAFGE